VFCPKLRSADGCGNEFGMFFVSATIVVNFVCADKQEGAKYLLKLVDNHLWVSSVADGYPNPDLRITYR
jgi:hypothetical protein